MNYEHPNMISSHNKKKYHQKIKRLSLHNIIHVKKNKTKPEYLNIANNKQALKTLDQCSSRQHFHFHVLLRH